MAASKIVINGETKIDLTEDTVTAAAVVIGTVETNKLFVKLNGSWVEVAKAYKKVNGSWVEQTDVTSVFSAGTNYRRGNS